MIKKIFAIILALSMLLLLISCGEKSYKPVPSTKEEAETVFNLGEFAVPYELFRTFFLTNKDVIDGGDSGVWLGSEAPEYRQKAIDMIIPQICDIYAMFTLCGVNGIDIYSDEIEERINELVKISVEGGVINGDIVAGHSSHKEYLNYLKQMHMNDSVSRLIMRYSICEEILLEKIIAESEHTTEDVYEFFNSDECVHITWLYRQYFYSEYFSAEQDLQLVKKAHTAMKDAENYSDIVKILVQYSSGSSADEIENGFYIGRYTLDPQDMKEITDAAFSLKAGEYSDIIENYYGAYIVYVMEKDEAYLETDKNYERIAELYINNEFYKSFEKCKESLQNSIAFTDYFKSLNFAEIEY